MKFNFIHEPHCKDKARKKPHDKNSMHDYLVTLSTVFAIVTLLSTCKYGKIALFNILNLVFFSKMNFLKVLFSGGIRSK